MLGVFSNSMRQVPVLVFAMCQGRRTTLPDLQDLLWYDAESGMRWQSVEMLVVSFEVIAEQ